MSVPVSVSLSVGQVSVWLLSVCWPATSSTCPQSTPVDSLTSGGKLQSGSIAGEQFNQRMNSFMIFSLCFPGPLLSASLESRPSPRSHPPCSDSMATVADAVGEM